MGGSREWCDRCGNALVGWRRIEVSSVQCAELDVNVSSHRGPDDGNPLKDQVGTLQSLHCRKRGRRRLEDEDWVDIAISGMLLVAVAVEIVWMIVLGLNIQLLLKTLLQNACTCMPL